MPIARLFQLKKIPLLHLTKFQKTFSVFNAARACSSCSNPTPDPNCPPPCATPNVSDPRVVIIGAGVAGLSAANYLMENGICRVTVLEASDSPGGRIRSCWLGDTMVELGAEWIKGGCLSNSAFTLAAQEDLLGKNGVSRRDPCRTGLFYTSNGKPIWPAVGLTAAQAYRKIEMDLFSLYKTKKMSSTSKGSRKMSISLRQYINERIMEELKKFPENQRESASKVMFSLSNETRYDVGESLSVVSADLVGSQTLIPGGDVRIPLGFTGVMAPLLRDLPEGCVNYCKPVALVRWGNAGNDRAIVVTADGDEYPADHVIITVSLGVLKACAGSIFCPSLPSEKTEAISKVGFGRIGKLFLEYEQPFWARGEGGVRLAWSDKELSERSPDGCDWARGITGFEEVPSSNMPKDPCCIYEPGSRVLGAKISGPEAEAMERADDDCIAEVVTRLIRTFTGNEGIPFPVRILRTSWCCDSYFRGGFSYLPVSTDLKNPIEQLCQPLPCCTIPPGTAPPPGLPDPILLFAGEATSADFYGTVHGALLSGHREAKRIIDTANKLCC